MKAYRDDLRGAGAAGLADRLQRVVACLLCGFVSATGAACAFGEVTPGWENVCPDRSEFPSATPIWTADFVAADGLVWELRDGAVGRVERLKDGVRIVKTNSDGFIVVKAKAFAVRKGRGVRFTADHTVADADVNYSSGALRYHGRTESFRMCGPAERLVFWNGGTQTMRGLPCTAPGMTYRKYAQCYAADDVLTPLILVSGAPSDSTWRNWFAEDLEEADILWGDYTGALPDPDYRGDRMDEKAFDAQMAAEKEHVAEVRRVDGVSRLLVDGEIIAPSVFKARHRSMSVETDSRESFAGHPFDGSALKLMVKNVRPEESCSADGSAIDVKRLAYEMKSAMRAAPNTCFVLAFSCYAPKDFIRKYHPEEAWLDEKGEPVMGLGGSCMIGYLGSTKEQFARDAVPWPSPASRVWRDWVCRAIRETVAELKAQGLAKRIVGIHVNGYHDGQFSVPYVDTSACAKAEYARMQAEPGCLSADYAFCVKQMLFRAQEEFVREFKRAIGKPTIGVMWCESPLQGAKNASLDITSFVNSDAMDVVVCQPNYRERLPAFPTVSALPLDSLHLHGKMFWNEYDYRTYAPVRTGNNAPSLKSLGTAADFPMWQTMYRKVAGEANATRMGYWFYDMSSGWYSTPAIAADIRRLVREEEILSRLSPSPWRPDVAVVVDELQILQEGKDPLLHITSADEYVYASSCRLFGTSGVPYERYLADDVLKDASLLKGKKMVVLAFFRAIDAKRKAFLDRLAAQGTTIVFLAETGVRGGAEATGFKPVFAKDGRFGHLIDAEPGFDANLLSLLDVNCMRDGGEHAVTPIRGTVEESAGVKVLARFRQDKAPALAERRDADCRRIYVCEPGGFTPDLMNRFARESGAYVPCDRAGLQVDMNGDFVSVHCLRPGRYDFRLPFDCTAVNLKTLRRASTAGRMLRLELTAGETVRFWIGREADAAVWDRAAPELLRLADFPAERVKDVHAAAQEKLMRESKVDFTWRTADGTERKFPVTGVSLPVRASGSRRISLHEGGTISARVFFDRPSVRPGEAPVYDGICMKDGEFLLGRMKDGVYFNLAINGKWSASCKYPKIPVGRWVDIAVKVTKGERRYDIRYFIDGAEVAQETCPLGPLISERERRNVNVGTCWGDQWRFGGKLESLRIVEGSAL